MTTGIYLLKFEGTNKVYIGQSKNIEVRYKRHLNNYISDLLSSKLKEAFKLFGKPSLEILEKCSEEELDTFEEHYIIYYDAVSKGFNSTSKTIGGVSVGETNGSSKYTNKQYIETFKLLLDNNADFKEISEITSVSISTIRHMSCGESHVWLKDIFPEEYKLLESLKGRRKTSYLTINNSFPKLISPNGEIFECTTTLTSFAKEHGLDPSALSKLFKQKYKTHKGWKLA